MAQVNRKPMVAFSAHFVLEECEVRALCDLVGYSDKDILACLGSGLRGTMPTDHRDGFIKFFAAVREQLRDQLCDIDDARKKLGISGRG